MREVKAKENKKELAAKKASKLTITKKAVVAPRSRTYTGVYIGRVADLLERETTRCMIVKLENKMELSPKYKRDYTKLDRKVIPKKKKVILVPKAEAEAE